MSQVWQNWSNAVSCTPHHIASARDEAELATIVHVAAREGRTVRPLGSGHSSSALCATDGVLLSLERWTGIESVDAAAGIATVRAGTVLHDLGGELHEHGLALHNLGDIDRQTLAGALSTGTHGTGAALGNLSSAVTALRLVTAAGEVLELRAGRPEDRDLMRAARVSLGALGILSTVTLRVLPAYRLHERLWRTSLDDALANLDEWVASHRHFEIFYFPKHGFAECKAIDPTESAPESVAGREGERIGWSHEILPSVREQKFHEMEYSVPAAFGATCFREMMKRLQARHPEVVWPMEYRSVAPDDALLSMAHGRDTVAISVHQDGRFAHEPVFAELEPIAVEAGGRPHWGKWHRLEAEQLARAYPEWERFRGIRRRLDPSGVLLSAYLRGLFGEHS